MKAKLTKEEFLQLKILICIRDGRRKSLEEVTRTYNRLYPVGIIKQVIGIHMSEGSVNRILGQLVKKKMVSTEYLSFTDRPLPKPTLHFCITAEGLQCLRKRQNQTPLV